DRRWLDHTATCTNFKKEMWAERAAEREPRINIGASYSAQAWQHWSALSGNRKHRLCVAQAVSHAGDQSITPVGGLQQQGSAIGTALPMIELQHGRLGENIGEQQTLCRAIV